MPKPSAEPETRIIMLVNLVQDVAVLHPLLKLCVRAFDIPVVLLVSDGFRTRDLNGLWGRELARLAAETGAIVIDHASALGAHSKLQTGGGVLIAASESDLTAHRETHVAMQQASATYLKITLQHGFECVGFLHGRGHDLAHGTDVRFAADVLAGWMPVDRLTALHRAERHKLVVTGPTASIDPPPAERKLHDNGVIAENLQSPRLLLPHAHGARFAETFEEYRTLESAAGRSVTLRPHPTGLGLSRTYPDIARSVEIDDSPAYDGSIARFGWAITPPSSIVFDLIRARVPVAVWNGASSGLDTQHYRGLTQVGDATTWTAFGRAAASDNRRSIIAKQEAFVERLAIPQAAADVGDRFLRLIAAGVAGSQIAQPRLNPVSRIVVVTDVPDAALEAQLVGALQAHVDAGSLALDVCSASLAADAGLAIVTAKLDSAAVDAVLFCNYSGADRAEIGARARARGIPAIGFPRAGSASPISVGAALVRVPTARDGQIIGCLGGIGNEALLDGLSTILADYPDLRVELIGNAAVPPTIARSGPRVTALPQIRPQRALIETICARGWTIGIAVGGALIDWLTLAAAGVAPLAVVGEATAKAGDVVTSATDADSWVTALTMLLADEKRRSSAADAAQAFANDHFADGVVLAAIDDVLREHGLRLPDVRRAVQSLSRAA